jgi:F420-0:gamma-glutamyl ligase
MIVTPIKTHKISANECTIFSLLDRYLPIIKSRSVVAVSSKIVALCEGRVEKIVSEKQKDMLVEQEAEYFLPREFNQYGFMLTINRGILVASAGIDESNGNGYFVLWPKDPQQSANEIRRFIRKNKMISSAFAKSQNESEVGVIITDSKLTPLRWGVTGVSLAHSGFKALKSYIGKPDIFGRRMRAEKSNVADSLATAAVAVMGEGNEQQPFALIEDVPFVQFQDRNPTKRELADLRIALEDDVYASLLLSVNWKKGKSRR